MGAFHIIIRSNLTISSEYLGSEWEMMSDVSKILLFKILKNNFLKPSFLSMPNVGKKSWWTWKDHAILRTNTVIVTV